MLSQNQIKKLEAKGGKLWTSKDGSKQRVYFKAWALPLVQTNWQNNGKKTLTYLGEELSYTKSYKLSMASLYIDVIEETIEAGIYDSIAALLASWLQEAKQEPEQEPEPTPCLSVAAAALNKPIDYIYRICLDAYKTPKGRAMGWEAVCQECKVQAVKWAALHAE